MRKLFFWTLFTLMLVGTGFVAWLYYSLPQIPEWPEVNLEESTSVHTIVIEEVNGLGRMELAQYHFSDVIEHSVPYEYLPDPKVLLKVYGEAVACVDFTRLDSSDIHLQGDSLTLDLPTPEICYSRIDHERSAIVDTWYTSLYAEGQKLIDEAYVLAERNLTRAALANDILDRAEYEAQQTLVPLLANLTQKQVFLRFPAQREVDLGSAQRPLDSLEGLTPIFLTPVDSAKPGPEAPTRPEVIRE